MPIPTYGAAPLAKTFLIVRVLSLVALLTMVGITEDFVRQIVNANIDPPKEIIGTLTVVSNSGRGYEHLTDNISDINSSLVLPH